MELSMPQAAWVVGGRSPRGGHKGSMLKSWGAAWLAVAPHRRSLRVSRDSHVEGVGMVPAAEWEQGVAACMQNMSSEALSRHGLHCASRNCNTGFMKFLFYMRSMSLRSRNKGGWRLRLEVGKPGLELSFC
eukprot:1143391-Pelagomonas_calceolata.AAC.2